MTQLLHVCRVILGVIVLGSLSLATELAKETELVKEDAKAPPEVAKYAQDWPLPHGDYAGSRAPYTTISQANVAELKVAWRYDMPGGSTFGNIATTSLIMGNRIFVGALDGRVHAVDRNTGEELWQAGRKGGLFGPTGVAVGWGKVFATKIGNRGRGQLIVAYDSDTGEELWATNITDITGNGSDINVQPFVYGGLVYAATSGFPAGVRGTIYALKHDTGEIVWRFATVESEDLWGNPKINSGGGTWYPPVLDTASETLFFGIGNPYPFPGAKGFPAGTSRPGDNRWTSGTVALHALTGEFKWGFQAFPHDIFDRDHILVALAEVPSEERTVLVTAGKGGVVIGLDPANGKKLWATPVGQHHNDSVDTFKGPLEVLPGAQGGIVTPIAVVGGVVYAAAVNAPTVYESPEQSSTGFGTQLLTRPSSVVAIDVRDGSLLWEIEIKDDVLGGMTVVNDLVFTATLKGKVLALKRTSGEVVWRYQVEGGINGWLAVAGDLMVIPVGFAAPPHLLALHIGKGLR